MKKLFVLAILILIGAVGYAFWQESKMVVQEAPWPSEVIIEFEGAPGETRPYKLEGDLNLTTPLPGNPVIDATFVLRFTETIGSPMPEGAFEVTYTCYLNPQTDIVVQDPPKRAVFDRIGMSRQLAELGGVVIKGIRHRNGTFEMTQGPSGIEGNFLLQAMFDQPAVVPDGPARPEPPTTWDRPLDLVSIRSTMAGFEMINDHRCAKITSELQPMRRQPVPGAAVGARLSGSMTTYFDYGMGAIARQTCQQTLKGGGQDASFTYTLSLDEPQVQAEKEKEKEKEKEAA